MALLDKTIFVCIALLILCGIFAIYLVENRHTLIDDYCEENNKTFYSFDDEKRCVNWEEMEQFEFTTKCNFLMSNCTFYKE